MTKLEKLKRSISMIGLVLGGTAMAALTVAVIYVVFLVLKIISFGIFSIAQTVLNFIVSNWQSSLAIIGILTIGIIEWEVFVLPKIIRKFNHGEPEEKNSESLVSDENSEEISDEEMATKEALDFLEAFQSKENED